MKTIILIRHAKSSWSNLSIKDFDRPLNDRGNRDAPVMGKWLKKQNEIPQLIISSTAERAKKTIEIIADEIGHDKSQIFWEELLYETNVKTWLQIVCEVNNKFDFIYVVGHNFTLTQFANYLCNANILNVPTCGMVKIEFDLDNWVEISKGTGNFIWHNYPKNLN